MGAGPSVWIIPALAGNTAALYLLITNWGDHPRSRGEYRCFMATPLVRLGSSPLSRGILPKAHRIKPAVRIIPALAGNTWTMRIIQMFAKDHPRSRGEYDQQYIEGVQLSGSSPLSRGIPGAVMSALGKGRIIPALAGNTDYGHLWGQYAGDHPRSRGEYPG